MINKLTPLMLFLVSVIFLAGCSMTPTPMIFDIPESTWQNMTPEQRDEVMADYHQQQQDEIHAALAQAPVKTEGYIFDDDPIYCPQSCGYEPPRHWATACPSPC